MGLRFQRRVTIFPGLRLNFGLRGTSPVCRSAWRIDHAWASRDVRQYRPSGKRCLLPHAARYRASRYPIRTLWPALWGSARWHGRVLPRRGWQGGCLARWHTRVRVSNGALRAAGFPSAVTRWLQDGADVFTAGLASIRNVHLDTPAPSPMPEYHPAAFVEPPPAAPEPSSTPLSEWLARLGFGKKMP